MFVGYVKQDALTRENFDGEWFDTGDLATLDAEGFIRITGRIKDIIIRGGENIPVKYVEDILYEDLRVQDAAIIGMPDPRLGGARVRDLPRGPVAGYEKPGEVSRRMRCRQSVLAGAAGNRQSTAAYCQRRGAQGGFARAPGSGKVRLMPGRWRPQNDANSCVRRRQGGEPTGCARSSALTPISAANRFGVRFS